MPKLSAGAVKIVDAAEARHESGGTFELWPNGVYLARLADVATQDPDKYGQAVWSAEFQDCYSIDTREKMAGRQWLRITLPSDPKKGAHPNYAKSGDQWDKYQAMLQGQVKACFESFG